MTSDLTHSQIGKAFVKKYYMTLCNNPEDLRKLYKSTSSFVHGGDDCFGDCDIAYGVEDIASKIKELDFRSCRARIMQIDCATTLGNGIVIQVCGELSNKNSAMRAFMQTFVLCPLDKKLFYVANDIFRYRDEVFSPLDDNHPIMDTANYNSAISSPNNDINMSALRQTIVSPTWYTNHNSHDSISPKMTGLPKISPIANIPSCIHSYMSPSFSPYINSTSNNNHMQYMDKWSNPIANQTRNYHQSPYFLNPQQQQPQQSQQSFRNNYQNNLIANANQIRQTGESFIHRNCQNELIQHDSSNGNNRINNNISNMSQPCYYCSNDSTNNSNNHFPNSSYSNSSLNLQLNQHNSERRERYNHNNQVHENNLLNNNMDDNNINAISNSLPNMDIAQNNLDTSLFDHQNKQSAKSNKDIAVHQQSNSKSWAAVASSAKLRQSPIGSLSYKAVNQARYSPSQQQINESYLTDSFQYNLTAGKQFNNNVNTQQKSPTSSSSTQLSPSMRYPDKNQIFVGNISTNVSEDVLMELLTSYGDVVEMKMSERNSLEKPKFAFVIFLNSESADSIIADSSETPIRLDGKRLNIERRNPGRRVVQSTNGTSFYGTNQASKIPNKRYPLVAGPSSSRQSQLLNRTPIRQQPNAGAISSTRQTMSFNQNRSS